MAIEMDIRIIGESADQVTQELTILASRLAVGLGAASPPPNSALPEPAAKANGVEAAAAPAKTRGSKKAVAPEPESEPAPEHDRAAIIDGLTKIYGKGDADLRMRITKFRDERGADRLRDLKDDDLAAAAQLLIDLKIAEAADAP